MLGKYMLGKNNTNTCIGASLEITEHKSLREKGALPLLSSGLLVCDH